MENKGLLVIVKHYQKNDSEIIKEIENKLHELQEEVKTIPKRKLEKLKIEGKESYSDGFNDGVNIALDSIKDLLKILEI